MIGKYITLQTLLACLTKPVANKKNIYTQLEETLAERRRILLQLETISRTAKVIDAYLHTSKAA